MNITEFVIRPEEIIIDPKMIAGLMRLNPVNIPEPYNEIIEKELNEILNYHDIKGGYIIFENIFLDPVNGLFIAEDVIFNAGKDAVHFLKNSEKLAFFICTAGDPISNRSKELMNSDRQLEAYINDIIGSVLVDEAMDIIHKRLAAQLQKKGLKTTNRYSPGNCDWNVDEQKKLFDLFPEIFCGVRLSDSSLMSPIKSISGVIGIGKNTIYHKNVCNICKNINCIYRDKKYSFEF